MASSALALATNGGVDRKVTSLATSAGVARPGSEAVALLERIHLEGVDGVDDVVEFILQLGIALDVDAAGEHQVDGVIEVGFGLRKVAAR